MILDSCCIQPEMEEFQNLGRCQALRIHMKRPFTLEEKYEIEDVNGDACSIQNERDSAGSKPEPGPLDGYYGLDEFRNNIVQMVQFPPLLHQDGSEDESPPP